MGETPCSNSLSSSSSCSVVAPYGADSNTEVAGTVRYTDFDAYLSSGSSKSTVSSFIQNMTGDNFYGTRMMVAEWNGVSQFNGISVSLLGVCNQRTVQCTLQLISQHPSNLNLDMS